jgi:hypothetical protein
LVTGQRLQRFVNGAEFGRGAGGWGGDTLESVIRTDAFKRKGQTVTNFASQLPAPQSELAIETLKAVPQTVINHSL